MSRAEMKYFRDSEIRTGYVEFQLGFLFFHSQQRPFLERLKFDIIFLNFDTFIGLGLKW